ncbi:MAG: HD-GYP domain-containing protein, partial [Lachnospiraceae bacterium]|nr:HD-GYP domain-containing protein [Lachnospiraceae bacterium]
NNSWCGKMEIHQFVDGEENIQTIDLRDYEEKDVTLKHFMAGQDLLIPLTKGDYLIYHPDDSGVSGESPLSSSKSGIGQALIGIIMYSESGEVDFSDFTLNYFIKKSYFAGTEGIVYLSLFAIWLLVFAFSLVVSLLILHFEGRLYGSNRMLEEAFKLCAAVSDIKDPYTKEHSYKVAKYARLIAEQMGMDKADCENVYYVAMVHDIGNYFIAGQILRKGEKLSRDEYEAIKSHTTKGAELLKDMVSLPHAVEGAMYHHERYDGSGYPMGMKGDDIPLIARIIAVADAYDAMSSDRAYRSRKTIEQIKQEMNEQSGLQFDPVIVKVFMEIIDNLDR